MKTVQAQKLRVALENVFERATENLRRGAQDRAPSDMDAETLAVHEKVLRDLNDLIRGSLKPDMLYCVPKDDFYPALARLLGHSLCAFYTSYEIAPDVTDEQILAHRAAIGRGRLAALEPLRRNPPQKMYEAKLAEGYRKYQQLFNNLAYYFNLMAHLAKHYGAREVAHDYLRAASIARKGFNRLPLNLTEDACSELLSLAEASADELKVAADYFALPDWEDFRAQEAKKLAAAEAKLRKETAR